LSICIASSAIAARAWADEVEKNQLNKEIIKSKDQLIIASNEASIKAGDIKVSEFCKSTDIIDLGRNQMYDWSVTKVICIKVQESQFRLMCIAAFLDGYQQKKSLAARLSTRFMLHRAERYGLRQNTYLI